MKIFENLRNKYEEHKERIAEENVGLYMLESALEGATIGLIISIPANILQNRYTDNEMAKALDYCRDRGYHKGIGYTTSDGSKHYMSSNEYVKTIKRIYRKKL